MRAKNYIFLTGEGFTFQPGSDCVEPDIENLQVIGFTQGMDSKDAFQNLIKENEYLLNTTFNEIFCYELARDYEKRKVYCHLADSREIYKL